MPRKPRPISSATVFTSFRCAVVSQQVSWMFSSIAPESSNWPAGSSVIEPPSRSSAITLPCSSTGCQPKRVRPRSIASMPLRSFVGRRAQVVEPETEFLVLGADLPLLARTRAAGVEGHQVVLAADRRILYRCSDLDIRASPGVSRLSGGGSRRSQWLRRSLVASRGRRRDWPGRRVHRAARRSILSPAVARAPRPGSCQGGLSWPCTENSLPQTGDQLFLTDGGIETTLNFHEGPRSCRTSRPSTCSMQLRGEAALRKLLPHLCRHRRSGTERGLVLESATWRASADWGTAARLRRAPPGRSEPPARSGCSNACEREFQATGRAGR